MREQDNPLKSVNKALWEAMKGFSEEEVYCKTLFLILPVFVMVMMDNELHKCLCVFLSCNILAPS